MVIQDYPQRAPHPVMATLEVFPLGRNRYTGMHAKPKSPRALIVELLADRVVPRVDVHEHISRGSTITLINQEIRG